MTTCVIKFHPRSFLVDSQMLDAQERGVLISLLSYMWSNEGHIADNEKDNARVCGARPSSYRKILARLVENHFLAARGGRIYPGKLVVRMISRVGLTPDQRNEIIESAECCSYCGTTEGPFVVDHIYPASKGGTNHRRNLTPACVQCNTIKRDMLPHEWEGLIQ